MRTVAIGLAIVFALLSLFHITGAFGAWRGAPVVPTIPGKITPWPTPASWLGVAAALALATTVVLARGDLILRALPPWPSTVATVVLGLVFVGRTIGDLRSFGLFRSVDGTAFARWDTWLYTPLCLAIGLSVLWLATTARAR